MKVTAIVTGLILCSVASAGAPSAPVLVGQTARESRTAGRIVVCKYAEANVRYEIVSDNGNCSASLDHPALAPEQRLATLQPGSSR